MFHYSPNTVNQKRNSQTQTSTSSTTQEVKKPDETINCCQKALWSKCFITKGKAPICEFYNPARDDLLRCRDMRLAGGDLYCACLDAQLNRKENSITDERLREKITELLKKYED